MIGQLLDGLGQIFAVIIRQMIGYFDENLQSRIAVGRIVQQCGQCLYGWARIAGPFHGQS